MFARDELKVQVAWLLMGTIILRFSPRDSPAEKSIDRAPPFDDAAETARNQEGGEFSKNSHETTLSKKIKRKNLQIRSSRNRTMNALRSSLGRFLIPLSSPRRPVERRRIRTKNDFDETMGERK